MLLCLTESQAQAIIQHTISESPREACGVIGGFGQQAHQIIPIPNVAADPKHYYEMDSRSLTEALFALENAGMSIIGFYHSHPHGDPIPSQTDIRQAYYPDTAYMIVGLRGSEPRIAAWQIRYGSVDRVELAIGTAPPESTEEPLSHAQQIAIAASALIALVLMLLLSLSLLPPPPPLPTVIP